MFNSISQEVWRPVVNYEGLYEVSNLGKVRRIGRGRGVVPGRILKHADTGHGYKFVQLWQNNINTAALVHRLVMYAFVGANALLEVNHINNDRADNRLENLEYVTRQQNVDHALTYGYMNVSGENNPSGKLTWQQVREIREKYTPHEYGYKRLASEYGVTWEAIRNIIKRRVWLEE